MGDYSQSSCGCCTGVEVETPGRIDNPPGLDSIRYRVGSHADFKASLLARLSGVERAYLSGLTTRKDSDFTVALCDALATTLDVLSFYQERIANENYLRTATERRSIMELARLIGYELAPGVAASTWLAFTLQETPGSVRPEVEPVTLPVGVRVQSVPGQDEQAQTFETVEPVEARVEWNAIPVQTVRSWHPEPGDTSLWLSGVSSGAQPGDAILIVGSHRRENPGSERWDIRLVTRVVEERETNRTGLYWHTGLGDLPWSEPAEKGVEVFVFRQRAALFGHNAPDPSLMGDEGGSKLGSLTTVSGNVREWNNLYIKDGLIDLDAAYPKVVSGSWLALVADGTSVNNSGFSGYVELYNAKSVSFPSRTDFALSGKITRISPDTTENLPTSDTDLGEFPNLSEVLALAQSERLEVTDVPLGYPLYGTNLALSGLTPGIMPGRALAVSGKLARIRLGAGSPDATFIIEGGGAEIVLEGDAFRLAGEPEEISGGNWVRLEPSAFASRINNGSSANLRLTVYDRDGKTGTMIVPASSIEQVPSRDDDPEIREIVTVNPLAGSVTEDRDRTTLTLKDKLKHCYDRDTARVNANVAKATHGETVIEVLGSGDARRVNARFQLRQSPLTYVSATTPAGRASTLELRANDMLWKEVPRLYGVGSDERVYSVRQDDEGVSSVLFGDGKEGALLPSGNHNIRAVYRKGLGLAGNVAAGKLTTLLTRPLGLSEAVNPEAATGGEDGEHTDQARRNAPLKVLTLDRAVSIRDYRDFARAFAGISKAHALWIPSGPAQGVFITVAGEQGAAIEEGGETHSRLLEALHLYGDPLMPIRVISYRKALFRLRVAIKVEEEADADLVKTEVAKRLRAAFGFEPREFAQTVSLDEVAAVAHGVTEVEAVQVREMWRYGGMPEIMPYWPYPLPRVKIATAATQQLRVDPRLFAEMPQPSLEDIPQAAELLVLDEEKLRLELMP